jgi:uncharacterized protein (DUF1697 family)
MPAYVAFLRAINVTGRFIKMSQLASAFHRLGHVDARAYINSGNVVFTSVLRSTVELERALEEQLEPYLGFKSEAFVRTAEEVKAIAGHAHSLRQKVGASGEVNVCFLQVPISPAQAVEVMKLRTDADDFEVQNREVYWLCRTMQSDSKFSNAVLERKLKLRSTLRRVSMLTGLAGTV